MSNLTTKKEEFLTHPRNIIFINEGLKLLHSTICKHNADMIETQNDQGGTDKDKKLIKVLRETSGVDDQEETKDMPNIIFCLLTVEEIKESVEELRSILLEELKPQMETLETSFHELTSK